MTHQALRGSFPSIIIVILFAALTALPTAVWGEGEEQGHKLEFPENPTGHNGIRSPCGGTHTGGDGDAITLAGGTHKGGFESCPPSGPCISVAGGTHTGGLESCPPSGPCSSVAGGTHTGGVETCPPGVACSSPVGGSHAPLTTGFSLEPVPDYVAWAARKTDASADSSKTIAVNPNGSMVYRTASISLSGGGKAIATYAYNAGAGNFIWGRTFSNPIFADSKAIAVNPNGLMVYALGSTFSTTQSSVGFIIIAYRATDGAVMWTRGNFGSPGSSPDPSSIVVSKDGTKVFAVGSVFNPATSADYKTIAYNAANGSVLWSRNYNGPDSGLDIAASAANSSDGAKLIVTGFNSGSGTQNYYTACYNTANGGVLWSKSYDNFGSDKPSAIAAVPGRGCVTGSSFGSGSEDIFTTCYNDTNGSVISAHRYDGPNSCEDQSFDIDADPNSTKYCIAGAGECGGNKDGYIACYDDDDANSTPDGVTFDSCYEGPASGSDRWNSIKIGGDGGVYITGTSAGIGTLGDCLSARFRIDDGDCDWKRRYSSASIFNQGFGINVSPDKSKAYASCNGENSLLTIGYFPRGSADLMVARTDEPNPVAAGQNLTSTITIKNNGPSTAVGIFLRNGFPINTDFNGRILGVDIDSVTVTQSQGECEVVKFVPGGPIDDVNIIKCDLGNLAPDSPPITVTVVGPTTAAGTFVSKASAFSGTRDPDISNNSADGTILVLPPQPAITDFSPISGQAGTSVAITGANLADATSVKFNGASATIISNSDTQIAATVPTGATTGKISVTTQGGTAVSSADFIIGAGISGFRPSSGPAGTNVAITGAGFTGAASVKFNGISAVFKVVSANTITATVPAAATSGKITVTTSGGIFTSPADFLISPKINSFSPPSGKVGAVVSITGTGFGGATEVKFNGTKATSFTVVSPTLIRAATPLGATAGPISVTTPSGAAASALNFTILKGISSFTPASGAVGTEVKIFGSGFGNATSVKFGAGITAPISITDSLIVAVVPPNATTGLISVSVPTGVLSSTLTFKVSPSITDFTPAVGAAGTSVTIIGNAFTGVLSVKFGSAAASFKVPSATSIIATVPQTAVSGPINVTTAAGTTASATDFTVLQPQTAFFQNITAQVVIDHAGRPEKVELKGSIRVELLNSQNGQAADADGDGLDEVPINVTSINFVGFSKILGPLFVGLPNRSPRSEPSAGTIEEKENLQSGRPDLPPFSSSGSANVQLKVHLEVTSGTNSGPNLRTKDQVVLNGEIKKVPPEDGETFTSPNEVELEDLSGRPVGKKARVLTAGACAVGRFEFVGGKTAQRVATIVVLWLPLIAVALLRRLARRKRRMG